LTADKNAVAFLPGKFMIHDWDAFTGLTCGAKIGRKWVLGDFDNTKIFLSRI
jgi:hypothetical protein